LRRNVVTGGCGNEELNFGYIHLCATEETLIILLDPGFFNISNKRLVKRKWPIDEKLNELKNILYIKTSKLPR
jgi:hypothetical protein